MSSAPISDVFPDLMPTTELTNGSPARAKDMQEARNRQWALQTGFGSVPICIHTPLTNDTFAIKLRVPPYVTYAWPAVQASCPGTGVVQFTVATHDATYGSRVTVKTVGTSSSELISGFFFSGSTSTAAKSSDEDAEGANIKCKGVANSTWQEFELTVEIPSNVTVYDMYLFWYHQTVT